MKQLIPMPIVLIWVLGCTGPYHPLQNNFLTAIRNGDTNTVRRCIAMRYNLNKPGTEPVEMFSTVMHESWTPLTCAAFLDKVEIGSLLIDAGADIEGRDGGGRTPLLAAVSSGHIAFAKMLLKRGADPLAKENKYSKYGTMDHALRIKNPELIGILLNYHVPLPARFRIDTDYKDDAQFREAVNAVLTQTQARQSGLVPLETMSGPSNIYSIAACKRTGQWRYFDPAYDLYDTSVLQGVSSFIDDLVGVLPKHTECVQLSFFNASESTLRFFTLGVTTNVTAVRGIYLTSDGSLAWASLEFKRQEDKTMWYSLREQTADIPLAATLFLRFGSPPKRVFVSAGSQ